MFQTKKSTFHFSILLLIVFLASCSNNNLDLKDDVSDIEVHEYDEETLVITMEDKEFIDKLRNWIEPQQSQQQIWILNYPIMN